MTRIRQIFIALLPLLMLIGSCGHSPWDDMPDAVASFVDNYFNEGKVGEAVETSKGFVVTFTNGPQITFNSDNEWTDINGRGETLPKIHITDQHPQKVVDYLTSMELLNGVYRIQRGWHYLRVDLSDSYFTYDDQTGQITYPEVKH